jgi:hypothetical protein
MDAWFRANPLPAAVVDAASLVARDLGLDADWLNPGPTGLLSHGLPLGFVDRVLRRDYGPALAVSFAARIDQIFFKLYAAADRREPRGSFDDALAEALNDLGFEDEGRDA